jgi:hypothetical protein
MAGTFSVSSQSGANATGGIFETNGPSAQFIDARAAHRAATKGNVVKAMHEKVKTAAKSYLFTGNAALKDDWSE